MGIQAFNTCKKAMAVTAMFHFKEYGCKIDTTALETKREIQEVQKMKILEARKKEEKAYSEKKRIYYEGMKVNVILMTKSYCWTVTFTSQNEEEEDRQINFWP